MDTWIWIHRHVIRGYGYMGVSYDRIDLWVWIRGNVIRGYVMRGYGYVDMDS